MCFNTFYVIQELIKSVSKPWARGIQIGLKDTMQTGTACRFLILFKYFIHDTKVQLDLSVMHKPLRFMVQHNEITNLTRISNYNLLPQLELIKPAPIGKAQEFVFL